jgi:hypothetical protein
MPHETVSIPVAHGPSAPPAASLRTGIDWKGIGYSISILSVLFLGAIAWPKPQDPAWHLPVLIGGMIAAIAGYGVRYMAHLKQKQDIADAKHKADAATR